MNLSLCVSVLAGICFIISSILYIRDPATAKIRSLLINIGLLKGHMQIKPQAAQNYAGLLITA